MVGKPQPIIVRSTLSKFICGIKPLPLSLKSNIFLCLLTWYHRNRSSGSGLPKKPPKYNKWGRVVNGKKILFVSACDQKANRQQTRNQDRFVTNRRHHHWTRVRPLQVKAALVAMLANDSTQPHCHLQIKKKFNIKYNLHFFFFLTRPNGSVSLGPNEESSR